jgi:hypothetical protein
MQCQNPLILNGEFTVLIFYKEGLAKIRNYKTISISSKPLCLIGVTKISFPSAILHIIRIK